MFCKREIEMSDRASGNWYPYNPDGTQHDCRNEIQIGTKKVEAKKEPIVSINQQRLGPLTMEEIEARLKNLGERMKRLEDLIGAQK